MTATSNPSAGVSTAPPQFKVTSPPVYYNVETTAVFSGSIKLCFSWTEGQIQNEANARLYHFDNNQWVDVTAGSADTVNNTVCGFVTSLSPFAIFEPDFKFKGFQPPISNPPVMNPAEAGSSIPVKFSISGNWGLAIFKPGFPASQPVDCGSLIPLGSAEPASAPGGSSLSYSAGSDSYTYLWKTDRTWNGCRQLILQFADGDKYTANFSFR